MLPHLRGRPVTMERFHKGIGEKGFIQKSLGKGTPEWIERVEVPKKGGVVIHPLINNERSLLWLANQNCITPHVWVSRVPDLDPMQDEPKVLREAAIALRDLLTEVGLTSWVKTSGSKGYHIVVPLDGKADAGVVSSFSNAVGALIVERNPKTLTLEFSKADRGGRIYMDTGRNHPPATFASVYAVRPRPTAPISAPCTWEEVESGKVAPTTFTLRAMAKRIEKVGDLWSDLHRTGQSIRAAAKRLQA
jgi:bifunctional non-homologous end joining protein LigD